jgi:hypothetical protein
MSESAYLRALSLSSIGSSLIDGEESMYGKNVLALFGAFLFALPLAGLAQSHDQLVQRYTDLAGSKENAESLVQGLRDGETVNLSRWTGSVMFIPPTGKMGYGNVDQALALAAKTLAKHGVTNPTPTELAYTLMGGNVKTPNSGTLAMDGILKQRAQGKGWGEMAQSYGVKLGEVKRPEKAERAAKAKSTPKVEPVAKVDRAEKPEKPQKPEKPERQGKAK